MSYGDAADPGALWRRVARIGALLCMIGTFLPLGNGNLWDRFSSMQVFAAPGQIEGMKAYGYSPIWLGLIVCFWYPALFSGFAFFIACSPYATSLQRARYVSVLTMLALFLLYTFVPPQILLKQLPGLSASSEKQVSIAMVACGLYVMLCGLLLLLSWDRRRQATFIFWMGALPLLFLLLRWVASLATSISRNYTWHFILLGIIEISGSLLLMLGWMLWWRAASTFQRGIPR